MLALLPLAACDDPGVVPVDSTDVYSTAPIAVVETRFVGAEGDGQFLFLSPGDSARIVVTPRDADGRLVRMQRLEWLFREPLRNVTVDSAGVVRALAFPGGGALWARVNGQYMSDILYLALEPRNPTPRLGGRWRLAVTDRAHGATLEGVVQIADSLRIARTGASIGARGIVLGVTTTYCTTAETPPRCDTPIAWPSRFAFVDTLGNVDTVSLDAGSGGRYESLKLAQRAQGDALVGNIAYSQYVLQGSRAVTLQSASADGSLTRVAP